MLKKEDILKQPSHEQFEEEMAKLDQKIKELRTKKEDLHQKRREIIDGGKMQGSSMTYREVLSQKINSMKEVNNKKRSLQSQVKVVSEELDVFESEKRQILKLLPNDCSSEEQINMRIKQLDHHINTTSMRSAAEENKIIKEISTLKTLVPKAKRFSEIKPLINELHAQKNTLWTELKEVKKVVAEKDTEIEALRKEMEIIKEGQIDVKSQGDKVTEQINKVGADITASFAAKDATREKYYKARYDFEVQRDEIHHIQFLNELKERAIRRVEDDKNEAERREQQIKDLPHPYAKEIETCVSLENYCHQLKRKAGLEVDSEKLAKDTQQNLLSEMNREQM